MVNWEGVFREESWATPLLVLSVITLCALMLYTVIRFCSWLKPTLTRGSTLLPWLEMPLLLGLMLLTGSGITAAAPLNDASCRLLFMGPSSGYVLVSAGLLSRVIQYVFQPHVFIQWLLLFFVALNQGVISVAYMVHSGWCQLTVQHQLLMLLYPGMLVGAVLVLVFKTVRKKWSKMKPREIIHVGLAATFSGAIGACWIGAATVLTNEMMAACLGYGCLSTVIVLSLILFLPRKDVFHDGIYANRRRKRRRDELVHEDPQIIVVPTASGEELAPPDTAVKETRPRHRRSSASDRAESLGGSRRSRGSGESLELRGHSKRHRGHSRPHRWNNKMDSVRKKSRKEKHRRRYQDHATQIYQTPDYYQAWLY